MELGDPRKMAMVDVGNRLPPMKRLEKMSRKLTDLLPCLFVRTTFFFVVKADSS